jgi:putative transposase
LRNSLRALRVKQRTVARRKKGSNRQAKAKHEVAVLHDQVANQRRDFWHRVTDWLTKNYAVIVIEDLTLDFMQQNKRLALSAADAGLGLFWQLLEDKAVRRGNRVIRVPAAYTSQECSGCGVLVPKKLSERTHTCVECGCVLDRDLNAAKVILKRGIEAAVQAAQGIT